ncbi:MAG TPA: carnitine dehydratase, partial [Nitrosomonas europaea]|nr:carnitine dehydratase [Nitrosomonas europaea]
MIKSLKDCTVSGPFRTPPSPFAAVGFSLNYQSGRLGLKVAEADDYADQGTFSFVFRAPQARLVNCVITGWSDCDQPGAITESMMQAACGLMSVHGRSTGAIQPFGLQYVSTVTTALALQGGMAAALGNLRGLAVSDSHISMAAAALLSTSQYI